jgi:hypothetical protein
LPPKENEVKASADKLERVAVAPVNHLINPTGHPTSGFGLNEIRKVAALDFPATNALDQNPARHERIATAIHAGDHKAVLPRLAVLEGANKIRK